MSGDVIYYKSSNDALEIEMFKVSDKTTPGFRFSVLGNGMDLCFYIFDVFQ